MKKNKCLLLLISFILIFIFLFLFKGSVKAENIISEKIVPSTNGSIDYIIKGLDLKSGDNYEWALETSATNSISNWYDVLSPEYSTGTIKISISSTNENHLKILKSSDVAYVTIRKSEDFTKILSNYKIDLSLPLLKVFTVEKSVWYDTANTNPAFEINTIYGIKASNVNFKWEKITDPNIVNNYIDNNHDLSGLNLKGKENFPSLSDTSWKSVHRKYAEIDQDVGEILNQEKPAEDGLYYLWLQSSGTDVKTLYGQAIIEIGAVQKIDTNVSSTQSPNTGNQMENKITSPNAITSQKGDPTTAKGILPNTGLQIGIIISIIILFGLGIFGYIRYHKIS